MVQPQTDLRIGRDDAEGILRRWLGEPVTCTDIEPLHGGMINSVLQLTFDKAPYSAVIKLSGNGDFSSESRQLRYLNERTQLPCPHVYLEDHSRDRLPYAFLLLETVPGVSMAGGRFPASDRAQIERELADALLELHSHRREAFGSVWEEGRQRWTDVFVPRLREVRTKEEVDARLGQDVLRDVDAAIEVAASVLADQGAPTLIHGDIWAANVMVVQKDDGWHLSALVDPGIQFADVEMELAYLQVFNTAGQPFFEAYTAERPLRPGYDTRKLFYWLRTYLVHVWLFGDRHYRQMTARVAEEIGQRTSHFV